MPADDRYETMPFRRRGSSGGLRLPAVSLGLWPSGCAETTFGEVLRTDLVASLDQSWRLAQGFEALGSDAPDQPLGEGVEMGRPSLVRLTGSNSRKRSPRPNRPR
jgi:hypothetical protein